MPKNWGQNLTLIYWAHFLSHQRLITSHEEISQKDDEYNIRRIKIDGIIVRFVQNIASIQITVEGDLPQKIIDAVTSEFLEKMIKLENTSCELKRR